jgi:DNA invertase Pin-like site-specific DNA recombinase
VFSDKAVSGKRLDRPGLNAALAALKPGMVLVVDTSDRLARDMLVCLTIRFRIEQAGAQLEYADGSPDHNTPEGELFQNLLAAFAQYERRRFARRTKAGLAKKKANGEWLGRPPIGWQIDKVAKKLVRNEHEQLAIDFARRYAAAHQPSAWIALQLNTQFGPCRGKPWSDRTVRKLLARTAAE